MQELKRAPRPGWTVFYSDLEHHRDARIASSRAGAVGGGTTTCTWLTGMGDGLRHGLSAMLQRVGAVDIGSVRIEMKPPWRCWQETADRCDHG